MKKSRPFLLKKEIMFLFLRQYPTVSVLHFQNPVTVWLAGRICKKTVGDFRSAEIMHGDCGINVKTAHMVIDIEKRGISLPVIQRQKGQIDMLIPQRCGILREPFHHAEGLLFFHPRPQPQVQIPCMIDRFLSALHRVIGKKSITF